MRNMGTIQAVNLSENRITDDNCELLSEMFYKKT